MLAPTTQNPPAGRLSRLIRWNYTRADICAPLQAAGAGRSACRLETFEFFVEVIGLLLVFEPQIPQPNEATAAEPYCWLKDKEKADDLDKEFERF